MSTTEPYVPPLPTPPTPPRSRSKTPFLLGCALLIFLVGGGCVALFLAGSRSVSAAKVPAEQFLVAIEQADYKSARQSLTRQTGASSSASSIPDIMSLLQKRHGKSISHTGPQNYNVSTFNGVTQVRLVYLEKFERGQTPVQLILTPENGQWKVAGFNFQL